MPHTPHCEVNRGGDHGPCDCGAERQEGQRADVVARALAQYGRTPVVVELAEECMRLRQAIQDEVELCHGCHGRGRLPLPCPRCTATTGEHEHVVRTAPCPHCAALRGAVEGTR